MKKSNRSQKGHQIITLDGEKFTLKRIERVELIHPLFSYHLIYTNFF